MNWFQRKIFEWEERQRKKEREQRVAENSHADTLAPLYGDVVCSGDQCGGDE